jgi:RecA-family ATPase
MVPGEVAGVFVGSGGAGKGIALQTLCTCVASGAPYFGYAVKQGVAVFWTAEDRKRQLLYRQRRITKVVGTTAKALADTLVLKSHRKPKCILWQDGEPTRLLLDLLADAENLKAKLLVIDSASLTYGDDEIRRRDVASFLRWLDLYAERMACTLIVILHTSRTSDDSVERLSSGSTAWIFQSRFALLLKKDDPDLSLVVSKINYGKPGLKIDLEWTDDGVLKAKPAPGTVERLAETADDKIVLAEIVKAWEAGDPLTMSTNSPRFLPAVLARLGRLPQKRALKAVLHLRDLGRIGPGPRSKRGIQPL